MNPKKGHKQSVRHPAQEKYKEKSELKHCWYIIKELQTSWRVLLANLAANKGNMHYP